MSKEPHPIQSMIEGLSGHWQRDRAQTQLTLGKLIDLLSELPAERQIIGLGYPHSYRGYYSDLSFAVVETTCTVAELLSICRKAMGEVFEGYKGGEYVMGRNTPLWYSDYGCASGMRIMGLDVEKDPLEPIYEKEPD
jgi:hypothetical protein